MKEKILRLLGYAVIIFFIFMSGVGVGMTETTEEENERLQGEKFNSDLMIVATQYQTLSTLCEQKYQTAIEGDMNKAYEIKGQMDTIETYIHEIVSRYTTDTFKD
jgi:hypothetical protein